MTGSSPESAESILSGLASLRNVLLQTPAALSIDSVGHTLNQLKVDLASLTADPTRATAAQLREIQTLSTSVQALYRSAATFFLALNPAPTYSTSGEWTEPSSTSARVRVEA